MANYQKKQFKNIQYLIYYPNDFDENKKYPLFFHLHGAGGRGKDFSGFNDSTILHIVNNREQEGNPLSKAVCVFPECHTDTWFDEFDELLEFTKEMVNLPFVDQKRVTGSGISMGGYGIYQVMMSLPELFNKGFVCCGGGMYWNAGRLKDIKFRIFHGEQDLSVYPEESKRMYARLKDVGADVTLVLYPECNHNCWGKAYSDLDNLKWIIE